MKLLGTALATAVLAALPLCAASAAPGAPAAAAAITAGAGLTLAGYDGDRHGGYRGRHKGGHHDGGGHRGGHHAGGKHHGHRGGPHGYKRPSYAYGKAPYRRPPGHATVTRFVSRDGCRVRVVRRTPYGKQVRVVDRCGYRY